MRAKNEVNLGKKVVVFDFDGTLAVNPVESHEEKRTLFFPETTKQVIEALINNGDVVVLSSHKTSKATMQKTLEQAGIVCTNIQFSDNTDQVYKDDLNSLPDAEAFASPKARLANQLKEKGKFGFAVVVDDQVAIKPEAIGAIHILVPTASGSNDIPSSDTYLRMALVPGSELEKTKEKAMDFKNNIRGGYLKADEVNQYYGELLNSHKQVINDAISKAQPQYDYSFMFQCLEAIAEGFLFGSLVGLGVLLLGTPIGIPLIVVGAVGIAASVIRHGFFSNNSAPQPQLSQDAIPSASAAV